MKKLTKSFAENVCKKNRERMAMEDKGDCGQPVYIVLMDKCKTCDLARSIENCEPCLKAERYNKINEILMNMPEEHRYNWCESSPCACAGCCNRHDYGLIAKGFTKQEWQEWVNRNPKPPTKGNNEKAVSGIYLQGNAKKS